MSIHIPPGRIVPQDHVAWLISRYGFKRILLAVLAQPLRRNRNQPPRLIGAPPCSAYLRRDIGLPPDPPSPRYWDLR